MLINAKASLEDIFSRASWLMVLNRESMMMVLNRESMPWIRTLINVCGANCLFSQPPAVVTPNIFVKGRPKYKFFGRRLLHIGGSVLGNMHT